MLAAVPAPHEAIPDPSPTHAALADGLALFIGRGRKLGPVRSGAIALAFGFHRSGATVSVRALADQPDDRFADLTLVTTPDQCERLFGFAPASGSWYMSSNLRAVAAAAIATPAITGPAQALYLRAKGLELACETIEQLRLAALTPCGDACRLSEADTRRIVAARDMIEAQLGEQLSLEGVAKACGVNRAKLSRGFRELFGMSFGQSLIDARMRHARDLLLTTDLRISTIGFRSGYFSNASFARAFARHFGVAPTGMRAPA